MFGLNGNLVGTIYCYHDGRDTYVRILVLLDMHIICTQRNVPVLLRCSVVPMVCIGDGIGLEMNASDNIADEDSKAAQTMRTMQFVMVIGIVIVVRYDTLNLN